MTVAELIIALQQFDEDTLVSVYNMDGWLVHVDIIEYSEEHKCVVIDA